MVFHLLTSDHLSCKYLVVSFEARTIIRSGLSTPCGTFKAAVGCQSYTHIHTHTHTRDIHLPVEIGPVEIGPVEIGIEVDMTT